MDTGFPRTVLRGQMESLTLTKDGTGRLWATWVEDAAVKYITSADGLTCHSDQLPVMCTACVSACAKAVSK